jgi:hypothetical protein
LPCQNSFIDADLAFDARYRVERPGLVLRWFGFEAESGLGEEPVDEGGRYWIHLSRFFTITVN